MYNRAKSLRFLSGSSGGGCTSRFSPWIHIVAIVVAVLYRSNCAESSTGVGGNHYYITRGVLAGESPREARYRRRGLNGPTNAQNRSRNAAGSWGDSAGKGVQGRDLRLMASAPPPYAQNGGGTAGGLWGTSAGGAVGSWLRQVNPPTYPQKEGRTPSADSSSLSGLRSLASSAGGGWVSGEGNPSIQPWGNAVHSRAGASSITKVGPLARPAFRHSRSPRWGRPGGCMDCMKMAAARSGGAFCPVLCRRRPTTQRKLVTAEDFYKPLVSSSTLTYLQLIFCIVFFTFAVLFLQGMTTQAP